MKQTRWLSEFSCLSEYTRLYPSSLLLSKMIVKLRATLQDKDKHKTPNQSE